MKACANNWTSKRGRSPTPIKPLKVQPKQNKRGTWPPVCASAYTNWLGKLIGKRICDKRYFARFFLVGNFCCFFVPFPLSLLPPHFSYLSPPSWWERLCAHEKKRSVFPPLPPLSRTPQRACIFGLSYFFLIIANIETACIITPFHLCFVREEEEKERGEKERIGCQLQQVTNSKITHTGFVPLEEGLTQAQQDL